MQLSFKPYLAAGSLLFSVCLTFFAGLTFLLAQIGFMRQVMLKVSLQGEGMRGGQLREGLIGDWGAESGKG